VPQDRKRGLLREVIVLVEGPEGPSALVCMLSTNEPALLGTAVLKLPPGEHQLLVRLQEEPGQKAGTLEIRFAVKPWG
jgi:hypothetical protein